MTIYSDTINNKFIGDCIFANHNISYPSINFLKTDSQLGSTASDLSDLCSQAGLRYRNVLPQSFFNTLLAESLIISPILQKCLLYFGTNDVGDIDDRFKFNFLTGGSGTSSTGGVEMYNHTLGATDTANAINITTNRLATTEIFTGSPYGVNGGYFPIPFFPNPSSNVSSELCFSGVSDGKSLGLFIYRKIFQGTYPDSIVFSFQYAGIVDDVNTNYNYYSANLTTKTIILSGSGSQTVLTGRINGRNYLPVSRYLLDNGKARYPIVCNDGQTPTATWATDFYVFDNNPALGYPAMGKVRNLLLATGTFTIGKPVRIEGLVFPGAGFNAWLPVGTYADKTVLMRCYSSVAL